MHIARMISDMGAVVLVYFSLFVTMTVKRTSKTLEFSFLFEKEPSYSFLGPKDQSYMRNCETFRSVVPVLHCSLGMAE